MVAGLLLLTPWRGLSEKIGSAHWWQLVEIATKDYVYAAERHFAAF